MCLGFQTTSRKTRDRLAFPPPSPLPGKSKFNFWIRIVNSQDLSETGVQTDWRESWSPCSQRTHTFLGGKGDGPRNPVCCIETTAGSCDHLFLFNRLAKKHLYVLSAQVLAFPGSCCPQASSEQPRITENFWGAYTPTGFSEMVEMPTREVKFHGPKRAWPD